MDGRKLLREPISRARARGIVSGPLRTPHLLDFLLNFFKQFFKQIDPVFKYFRSQLIYVRLHLIPPRWEKS
jgi:hypothetical protein